MEKQYQKAYTKNHVVITEICRLTVGGGYLCGCRISKMDFTSSASLMPQSHYIGGITYIYRCFESYLIGGHGDAVVNHSPPNSEIRVSILADSMWKSG